MNALRKLYALLVTCANSLQSLFLLFVRLYWGWQFVVDGWGKLHNLARVTRIFWHPGIACSRGNRLVYFRSGIGRRNSARDRARELALSLSCSPET